jgi:nucleotide-binding universal stress UspA family protein
MIQFNRILFPVSLTNISPKLVPYVETMATKHEAEIHLLHVAHEFNQYVDTYITQKSETDFLKLASNFEKEFLTMANNRLTEFKDKYFKEHPKVRISAISGQHYKEILNYIDKENIDLVIMGTGRGLHKAIFGSVTDKVAKLAKVPVMLIQTA